MTEWLHFLFSLSSTFSVGAFSNYLLIPLFSTFLLFVPLLDLKKKLKQLNKTICLIHLFVLWPLPPTSTKMYAAAAAKSLQSCPTLCDPIDGSPPASAIPGILQARTVEWVAISFSNAWKWKVKGKLLSRVWLLATPWTTAYQAPHTSWKLKFSVLFTISAPLPKSVWCVVST